MRNKITILLILGIGTVITNPLIEQVIGAGIDKAFEIYAEYNVPANLVLTTLLVAFIGWLVYDSRDTIKIPANGKQTKPQAYKQTN